MDVVVLFGGRCRCGQRRALEGIDEFDEKNRTTIEPKPNLEPEGLEKTEAFDSDGNSKR